MLVFLFRGVVFLKKFCLACFFKFICLFLSLVCFNSLLVYAEVANLNTDVPVDLQHQADLSNYYDVYSFDTFFLRQFQLAKESSKFKQELL